MTIRTIGLDLAKSVFQAHGVDETGATLLTKRLHRKQMLPFFSKLPPCLIGMEACGTAHHWARTLTAMGHEVRLIPPSYVKAFVKRGKSELLMALGPDSFSGISRQFCDALIPESGQVCLPE